MEYLKEVMCNAVGIKAFQCNKKSDHVCFFRVLFYVVIPTITCFVIMYGVILK